MFDQSTYSVTKDDILARFTLVLSKPSSTSFTVEVTNTDGFAAVKYYRIFSAIYLF